MIFKYSYGKNKALISSSSNSYLLLEYFLNSLFKNITVICKLLINYSKILAFILHENIYFIF